MALNTLNSHKFQAGTRLASRLLVERHTEWQALQTHLRSARASFETGDRISALEEIDAVLRIDPNFLAAHSLRDRILNPPDPTTGSIPVGLSDEFEVSPDADERRHPAIDFSDSEIAMAGGATTDQSDPFQGLGTSWVSELAVEESPASRFTRELSAEKDDLMIDFERRVPETPALVGTVAAATHSDRGPLAHGLRLGSFIALVALALFFAWNSGLRLPTRTGPAQVASRPSGQPSDAIPGNDVLAEATAGRQDAAAAAPSAVPAPEVPQTDASRTLVSPTALAAVSVPAERDSRSASSSSLSSGAPSAALVVSSPADAGADTDVAADDRVRDALQQFRRGFESLDVLAVRDAWPTVNVDELARTFRGLESQHVTFDDCSVRRSADAASAACRSHVEYVPKGGVHSSHVEARVWTFNLHNVSDTWKIDTARFTAFSETERVSGR
jgi:hypothetical protein